MTRRCPMVHPPLEFFNVFLVRSRLSHFFVGSASKQAWKDSSRVTRSVEHSKGCSFGNSVETSYIRDAFLWDNSGSSYSDSGIKYQNISSQENAIPPFSIILKTFPQRMQFISI